MQDAELSTRKCIPCNGGMPALDRDEAERFLNHAPGWTLEDEGRRIERHFSFRDYRSALRFVVDLSQLAEDEGHHPDISFGWGRATVSWQTKKIKGLHENDFIMAAKTNDLAGSAED